MGENSNISKMAEYLSSDLFSFFGWEKEGPININWDCVDQQNHMKNLHPTDVVYSYIEPYENKRTYINCDLKSYKSNSIKTSKIKEALKSLAMSVKCASMSSNWQSLYLRNDKSPNVVGLLFIYNHDCAYDLDFETQFANIDSNDIDVPANVKLFVLSPNDISNLFTIVTDINILKGKHLLPSDDKNCSFFYPDKRRSIVLNSNWRQPATIETLLGPWIIVKFRSSDEIPTFDTIYFYYKGLCNIPEEFVYIFNYLFHYQVINDHVNIVIKGLNASPNAAAIFGRAIKWYQSMYEKSDSIVDRLKKIKFETCLFVQARYIEMEIGMEDRSV